MDLNQYINTLTNERKSVFSKYYAEDQRERVNYVWSQTASKLTPGYKDTHPEITKQLISYIMRSKQCTLDLNKGLLLIGPTGTGKTRTMQTLSAVIGFLQEFRFKIYSGNDMERAFRLQEGNSERVNLESALRQKMFGIDDLGEEHDSVKVYGTNINVGIEALTIRYNEQMSRGSLTFATTNLDRAALKRKYGARIDSRIDEMFNVIFITGKDLRKEQ